MEERYIIDTRLCTGCGVCRNICPVSCISFEQNEEGFSYPVKGQACIMCGKCVRECPINYPVTNSNYPVKAFCGATKDKEKWRRSSSGGAFLEICKAWDDGHTIFVGATWSGFTVKLCSVDSIERCFVFHKSKYIESETKEIYREIKTFLDDGKRVVFSGTPCQIAGLRKYLSKEYEELLLIDIICHGVGSPKVFKKCLEVIEEDLNCLVTAYEFRYKNKVYTQDHIEEIITSTGDKIYLQHDRYLQLFVSQRCLRKSCGINCIFRKKNRMGDITIGDFKGLAKVFPDLSGSKRNYSSIVINNKKGLSILPYLQKSMELHECSIENIIQYNPVFASQSWVAEDRDEFFSDFIHNEIGTIKKWTTPSRIYKRSVVKKVYDLLPVGLRRIIISIRK